MMYAMRTMFAVTTAMIAAAVLLPIWFGKRKERSAETRRKLYPWKRILGRHSMK